MLSERLKNKELFPDSRLDNRYKKLAKDLLKDVVENLVIGMRVAEYYSNMSAEEVEQFVIEWLEECEKRYYSETPEDFDYFVRTFLGD